MAALHSVSLLLKSETILRLFFEIADHVDPETVTFNGSKYTGKHGDLYDVDITNIAAKDLDKVYSVEIIAKGETITASYSAMRYCYNVLIHNSE